MADRGRDLKFSVLSDVDRFDLTGPAQDIEDVGDAASKMGGRVDDSAQELKRLALQGKDAQRELDRLETGLDHTGDGAERTAKKVDSAFEKIATSSRSNLRGVGKDADRGMSQASEATATFKDEAKANLSEVASSFTGSMDSAVDVVQGTLGGIVSDLGPVGAAVGAIGAAAVGAIYAKVQQAREAVNDLARELIDSGKGLGVDDIFTRIADASVDDRAKVERLIRSARDLGLATSDVAVAFSGSSSEIADYIDRLEAMKSTSRGTVVDLGALADQVQAGGRLFDDSTQKTTQQDAALSALQAQLESYRDQAKKAEEVQRLFAEATGVSLETLTNYESAITTVAGSNDDLATATEAAAARQAKATKSTEDTWEDYRDTAVASIDDVIAAQERDIRAAADFERNSRKVFDAVGQAGLDWALAQGENADKAMALLASAPRDKQAEIVRNYRTLGQQSGLNLAQGLTSQKDEVGAAGAGLHGSAALAVARRLDIPIGLKGPTAAQIASLRVGVQRAIGTIPVELRVSGQNIYSNNANNDRYRW